MKKYKINMQTTVGFETTVDAQDAKDAKQQAIKLRNEVVFKTNSDNMTPGGYNGCSKYGSVWNCMLTTMQTNEIPTKRPLILLCGKSGSGKTTVANLLTEKYGLKQLESCTTRPPRKDGEGGHIFTSLNLFKQHVMDDEVIAEADINGYKYWATKDQLDNADIYVIDPKTALELAERVKDKRNVLIIYLDCSEVLRIYRMTKRGDALADIRDRVFKETVGHSLTDKNWDDYIINNEEMGQVRILVDGRSSHYIAELINACWNRLEYELKE